MAGMGGMGGMAGMGVQGLGFGFQNAMAGRLGIPGMQQAQAGSSVILVSNLDEQVRLHILSPLHIAGQTSFVFIYTIIISAGTTDCLLIFKVYYRSLSFLY